MLATDGITEASEPDGPEFGEESLALAARTLGKRSAAEMNSLILERVSSFCKAQFQDDATLLVIAAK